MSQPTDSQNEPGHGFQPVDLLVALRRRFWLIVLIGSLGGGIATTIALLLPNKYEAVATVQIDPRKKTIVSLDAVLPDIAGDTPTIESQVEILKSRVIALRVIDALGLRRTRSSPTSVTRRQPIRTKLPQLRKTPTRFVGGV